MKELFEYSDILKSPIEAFYCKSDSFKLPVEAHWHYFVEILYMFSGSAVVKCNDASYTLSAGSFVMFPPQSIHSIDSDNGNDFNYLCVKFNLSRIQLVGSYLPNLNGVFHNVAQMDMPPIIFSCKEIPGLDLDDIFHTIKQEVDEKAYGYNSYIYTILSSLIVKVLRQWRIVGADFNTEAFSSDEADALFKILVYIDEHSQENINVAQLAADCNMSYSYFAKLFHKHYGQSCKQYIEFIRLSKVENLLLFTSYDLSYISEETGFSDCSHLIRTFKKRYGITPKQFRLTHNIESR